MDEKYHKKFWLESKAVIHALTVIVIGYTISFINGLKRKKPNETAERRYITDMSEIKKVSIIGMGALGLMYGNMIAQNCGINAVQFLMNRNRYEKYRGQKYTCNGEELDFQVICDEDAEPADLLIVAVKATGLEAALESMKYCIGPNTAIVSVMNGISSEQMIGDRYGYENIVYTVAQGMDAMKFGNALNYVHKGELRIGITESGNREVLSRVEEFFDRAGIPYLEENDILYRLWGKFMLNVGINQTCMVYGVNYGQALSKGEANRTMIAAMREVIALANAEGICLSEKDLNQYIVILGGLSPDGVPSMAQDRINRKYSEVESFAGTVITLAQKHHLYVPANEYLYEKVREIEKLY